MRRVVQAAMVTSVAVVALTGAVVAPRAPAGAGPRASPTPTAATAGYWLMTGWGTGFAFGSAPYLGSPEAYGSDQCVNSAAVPDPPFDCVGLSAAPDGKGFWIGAGSTAPAGCTGGPVCVGEIGTVSAFGVGTPVGAGPSVVDGLDAPVVGVAAARGGVARGIGRRVFAMAGATFHGSMAAGP